MYNYLKDISIGDFIHARGEKGAVATCLVLNMRDGLIFTRSVTTHLYINFSEKTGKGTAENRTSTYIIECTKEMPTEVQNTFMEIDWKFNPENSRKTTALTPNEISAFEYADLHVERYKIHSA